MTDWAAKFQVFQKMSVCEQQERKEEIIKLFREFWVTWPDESLFADCMFSIVVFPEIFYIMVVYRRVGGRGDY